MSSQQMLTFTIVTTVDEDRTVKIYVLSYWNKAEGYNAIIQLLLKSKEVENEQKTEQKQLISQQQPLHKSKKVINHLQITISDNISLRAISVAMQEWKH